MGSLTVAKASQGEPLLQPEIQERGRVHVARLWGGGRGAVPVGIVIEEGEIIVTQNLSAKR